MNEFDFSFEQTPWEAFRMTKGMGDTVSAVTLLSLLEGVFLQASAVSARSSRR